MFVVEPFGWVGSAAYAGDKATAMKLVRVASGTAVATDGHRLHVAPVSGFGDGFYDADKADPAPSPQSYPDVDRILTDVSAQPEVAVWPAHIALSMASVAAAAQPQPALSVPGPAGPVTLNARFMKDALAGLIAADGQARVIVRLASSLQPVGLGVQDRFAVLMPLLRPEFVAEFNPGVAPPGTIASRCANCGAPGPLYPGTPCEYCRHIYVG
jgi:hypothetical protein